MYNNNGYQQQQGGYQNNNYQDDKRGAANEYYSEGQQQYGNNQRDYNQPPPQYQQQNSQYGQQQQQYGGYNDNRDQGYGNNNQGQFEDGQEGERGFMGGLAGAAAGGYGAYKLAGPATGHKKTSGLVGVLGGALAGHAMQEGAEHWKESHDEKKKREEEEKKHKHDNYNQQAGHHDAKPRGGHYAGGFTGSSQDVRLDAHGEYTLHAQCRRVNGDMQSSSISLNRILENENGSFVWSTGHHSQGGSETVIVQSGDTLRAIAARHNCSYDELARNNGIVNADMIYPGQRLEMPGGGRQTSGGGNFGASARNARLLEGGQILEAELMRNGEWVTASIVLDERIGNRDGCLEFV